MGDLAEFLLERIAEDEEVASDAAGWRPSGRERSPGSWQRDGLNSVIDIDRRLVIYGDGPSPGESEVEHIARHDPARVLAECEAKRRIVEGHGANRLRVDPCDAHDANFETVPCDTLRLLALPYSGHPDCREEWKP